MSSCGSAQGSKNIHEAKEERCDTFVIRNLVPNTDVGQIIDDLHSRGFKVFSVRNAVCGATQHSMPLFFVKLKKSPMNEKIYDVKFIAHQVVFVEEYHPVADPPICNHCQRVGHFTDECSSSPVCSWCSGPHLTRMCCHGRDAKPTCSRCGGRHTSNYKGCSMYKKEVQKIKKTLQDKNGLKGNNKDMIPTPGLEENKMDTDCDDPIVQSMATFQSAMERFANDEIVNLSSEVLSEHFGSLMEHNLSLQMIMTRKQYKETNEIADEEEITNIFEMG